MVAFVMHRTTLYARWFTGGGNKKGTPVVRPDVDVNVDVDDIVK